MQVVRLSKDDKSKWVTSHVFDAKGAEYWKAQGFEIDPKPYKREIDEKGAKYVLDKEAWQKEEEMRERADKEGAPKAKRTRRKKAEEPQPEESKEEAKEE